MKNRMPAYAWGFFLVSLLFVACQSTPKSEPAAAGSAAYGTIGSIIAEAKEKRLEITDNHLETVDKELFAHADSSLANAESLFNKGEKALTAADKNTALKDAQVALTGYSTVLNKYWMGAVTEARNRSLAAQQEALKVRAEVAVRDDYQHSTEVHTKGELALAAQDYKSAIAYFGDSASLYSAVAATAAEKRRLAALALQAADTKILESEKIAAEAEAVLTVGKRGE